MTYDETDTCWHIMTVTNGGTVSLLKNMDAPTARQAYQRLRPEGRPKKYINRPESGVWGFSGDFTSSSNYDRQIKDVHVLGPEGAELDPWRGVEAVVIDLAGCHSALLGDRG